MLDMDNVKIIDALNEIFRLPDYVDNNEVLTKMIYKLVNETIVSKLTLNFSKIFYNYDTLEELEKMFTDGTSEYMNKNSEHKINYNNNSIYYSHSDHPKREISMGVYTDDERNLRYSNSVIFTSEGGYSDLYEWNRKLVNEMKHDTIIMHKLFDTILTIGVDEFYYI